MSGSPTKPYFNSRIFPLSGPGRVFLVVFFLFFMGFTGSVVGQNLTTPTYDWESEVKLPTVYVTSSGVNTDDITISVATDPQGNVYTLSFGKGVAKRSATGTLINANFIPASRLDSPLDMAIDKEGFIYIADYFAGGETYEDNGKIWVFSPEGTLLTSRTIYTSFYRPIGLDVDEDKVYVAEYNDGNSGPERNKLSRIRIYDKTSGQPLNSTSNVNTPFRIAVDSKKRVYVSQAGNDNPSVRIYDENLVFQSTLPNIISPGSIVIDPFDFIHVIEYDGRIKFSQLINFENLTLPQVQALAKSIDDGQKANAFSIKIFDPNRVLKITLKNQIDFPVDLTFNNCERMYVNNSKIYGKDYLFIGYIPEKWEFNLEIYKRMPSFDLTKPQLTCPANIAVTAASGETSAVVNYTPPTPADNCSTPQLTRDGPAPGSNFPLGNTTITYTATDAAGNFETCSFIITVNPAEEDTEDPVITCPSNITKNADTNLCGAVVNYAIPTATDNSGEATVTLISGLAPGEVFPVGPTTVTYRAEDAAGNTDECSFTVTVTDNQAPTITCPPDINENVEFGASGKVITYNAPLFDDNCSDSTIEQTAGLASGSEFPLGSTTNTFVVTDAKGNKASCSFTVTISENADTEDPVITCPSNITQNVDPNLCGAVVNYAIPTATDNSGEATVTLISGLAPGEVFPVGPSTVTYRAEDATGNTDECSFTVTVTDNQAPTITCPPDINENVEMGASGKVITYNAPSFDDNCSDSTIEQTAGHASGSEFPLGSTINTFVVTDAKGNKASCSFTVTISENEDKEDPVITCPQNITQNVDPDVCVAVVNYNIPTATDNSGEVTVTLISGLAPGEVFPVGPTTVTYRTEDATGNNDECSFTVTITDNIDPTITCPDDISENVGRGATSKVITYNAPSFDDNCSDSTIEQTAGLASGSEFPLGSTINTFVVTDASGNTATCSFTVKVTENEVTEDPVITCPSNITQNADTNLCGAVVNYNIPTATDNSGEVSVILLSGLAPGEVFPVGSTTVTYQAEDTAGNTDECSFTVTVTDNIKPIISCPEDQIENFDPSIGFPVLDYTSYADVSDNCDGTEVTQTPAPGTIIYSSTQIILTVTDNSGNTAQCDFMLQLTEEEILEITCIADRTIQLTDSCSIILADYTGEAQVNLAGATVVQSPPAGTIITSQTTVKLTASLNGETDECTFNVIPNDIVAPEITCIDNDTEFVLINGSVTLSPSDLITSATDNCTVNLSLSQTTFTAPGTYPVVVTAADGNGNFTECTRNIKIVEATTSDFGCRTNDIILLLDATGNAVLKPEDVYTGSPGSTSFSLSKTNFNCSNIGNNEVTVSYSGEYEGSCTVKVVVKDEIAPIVRTRNISMVLNSNGVVNLTPELINEGSFDNCSTLTYSIDKTTLRCKDVGQNTITLTATDASGNISTGTAIVTLTGLCEDEPQQPEDGGEIIYIYPNPTTGPVNFYVPKNKMIKQVELYDSRGRFILKKEFPEATTHYEIDLSGLQSSVYIFKVTNESGIQIIRVIVK